MNKYVSEIYELDLPERLPDTWYPCYGAPILIADMETSYIKNCIKMMERTGAAKRNKKMVKALKRELTLRLADFMRDK